MRDAAQPDEHVGERLGLSGRGAWILVLLLLVNVANFVDRQLPFILITSIKAELQLRVQEALNELDPVDREILALRHFERLSNGETAAILGLGKSTASSRYLRALQKIKKLLARDGKMFE